MHIIVLGSSAGGGFPQWNCNCPQCAGYRTGSRAIRHRTQSSIIACTDPAGAWALMNASPDILEQIRQTPALHPRQGLRDSGIAGVILVDGQIDHSTGLYMLRESTRPLALHCTDPVFEDLTQGNPVLQVLSHYCGIDRRSIPLDGSAFAVAGVPGLTFQAVPLSSKAAPYSPHREHPVCGDNIGLILTDQHCGKSLFYAPGLGAWDERVHEVLCQVQCVMVDGTFWTDREMLDLGLGTKTARDIGHLPQTGPGGMMEWLATIPATTRKVLIHINNTNPILDENSPQRAQLLAQGIEVAWDGMHIQL